MPQVFLNDLITKDFHDWPVAKEWVLEMSRRLAMHGRPSKPLHLAEAEGAATLLNNWVRPWPCLAKALRQKKS